jgi:hypothetical protein
MYRTMDCDQLGEEVEYLEAEVCQMKVSPLFLMLYILFWAMNK